MKKLLNNAFKNILLRYLIVCSGSRLTCFVLWSARIFAAKLFLREGILCWGRCFFIFFDRRFCSGRSSGSSLSGSFQMHSNKLVVITFIVITVNFIICNFSLNFHWLIVDTEFLNLKIVNGRAFLQSLWFINIIIFIAVN